VRLSLGPSKGPAHQVQKGDLLAEIWLLIGVLLASGLLQGIAGFGFNLFALGVLGTIMPMSDAVVIVSVAALFSFAVNLWAVRRDVPWRDIWPLVGASLPALLVGVYCLHRLDDRILRAGLGVAILAGCSVMLWAPKAARLHRGGPGAYLAGALGGFFGGAVGASGPPIVLYTLLRGWDKSVAKGAMSAYFLLMGLWRIAVLVATGVATEETMRKGALLLIPAIAASYLGTRIFRRMTTRMFRYVALVLLAGLSVRLVFVG